MSIDRGMDKGVIQHILGFPYSSAGKESTCNAGDLGSSPGSGRFPTMIIFGKNDYREKNYV